MARRSDRVHRHPRHHPRVLLRFGEVVGRPSDDLRGQGGPGQGRQLRGRGPDGHGGKPPYVYSFASESDDIVPVNGQKSADGRIVETVSAKKDAKLPAKDKLKLTFTVPDGTNAKASAVVAEPTPTPAASPGS